MMSTVFISYAREDIDFVQRLYAALNVPERNVYVDWEDIPPAAQWRAEVRAAIEGADAFVFVVSPNSVHSPNCRNELAVAAANNKRLIALIYLQTDENDIPPALAELNWIFARSGEDFNPAIDQLNKAIETDLNWVRTHTRLLQRAVEWNNKAMDNSFLLRGIDLQDAERWLAEAATGKEPKPTELHVDYLRKSQEAQQREMERLKDLYNRALSRQLAAQAELLMDQQPHLLQRGVLLASESLIRLPSSETDQILRSGLRLLPSPVSHSNLTGGPKDLAFSPDGKYVALASTDNMIRVLEAHTGRSVAEFSFRGTAGLMLSIAFSPDGNYLAVGGEAASAQIWDIATCQLVSHLTDGYAITALTYSPDGKYLATGNYHGQVRVWEAPAGRLILRAKHRSMVRRVAFSPDGDYVAAGGLDGLAQVWRFQKRAAVNVAKLKHQNPLSMLAFSPDSKFVITGDDAGLAHVWKLQGGVEVSSVNHGETSVQWIAFHQTDSNVVITVGVQDDLSTRELTAIMLMWNLATGKVLNSAMCKSIAMASALSPDGLYFAIAGWDGAVRVWMTTNGHEVARPIHEAKVLALEFSPDGQLLATADMKGALRTWTTGCAGEFEHFVYGPLVSAVALAPDGRRYATATGSEVCVDDIVTGAHQAKFTFKTDVVRLIFGNESHPLETNEISSSGSSRDSQDLRCDQSQRLAVICADKTVRILDLESRRKTSRLRFNRVAKDIAISPNLRWLAVACLDKSVRIWNLDNNRALAAIKHKHTVLKSRFSADGRFLVTSSEDGVARIWELPGCRLTSSITLKDVQEDAPAATLSTDGAWLATGNADLAQVWEVATGRESARMVHAGASRLPSVNFSPDGRHLATVSVSAEFGLKGGSHRAHVWDASSGKEVVSLSFDEPILGLAFSKDGRFLVTLTGEDRAHMVAAEQLVLMANASRRGRLPAAVRRSIEKAQAPPAMGTLCWWYWQPKDIVARACERLTRNLTPEEWRQYLGDEPYHRICIDLP